MNFELAAFQALHNLTGQSKILDWFVVFLGEYLPYLLAFAAIYWIWREENWRRRLHKFAFVALVLILSRGILTPAIRALQPRPRPFEVLNFLPLINHEHGASIPSGHAAFYFALAFAVFLFNRKWGFWFLAAALLISVARVIAGVHWPLDIVAGMLVGLVSAFMVKWLLPPRSL